MNSFRHMTNYRLFLCLQFYLYNIESKHIKTFAGGDSLDLVGGLPVDNNASSTTPSSTISGASTTVYTQSCANGNAVIGVGSMEEPTETLLDSAVPPTPATALPVAPVKPRSPPVQQPIGQTPITRFPFDIIMPPNDQHTPRGMEMKEVLINLFKHILNFLTELIISKILLA